MEPEQGATLRGADWEAYFRRVAGRSPRPDFLDALAIVPSGLPRVAVELGAGDGVEAAHLLDRGWVVHAMDSTRGLRRRVISLLGIDPGESLTAEDSSFAELSGLANASFVYAGLSLPFAGPADIAHVVEIVSASLVPGGVFAGHFLGEHDSWATRDDISVHKRAEVEALLGGIGQITIKERVYDGPSGVGPKHWHIRFAIARRAQ